LNIAESFLDWEKNLKKEKKEQILNPLGMSQKAFRDFMKKWREENLK
jgi:hypothetical protein